MAKLSYDKETGIDMDKEMKEVSNSIYKTPKLPQVPAPKKTPMIRPKKLVKY